MRKYKLEITERQAERIIFALDLYTRLSAGQLSYLRDITFEKDGNGLNCSPKESTLELLQREMFPYLDGLNNSYGIHSKKLPEEIKEAYDIFKVMMFEFNKDKGSINVYADKVRKTSKYELPKFSLIGEAEE